MIGVNFSQFVPSSGMGSNFENLLNIFLQLLTYSSGDIGEVLRWMNQLDERHNLTNDEYGMGDFIQDLKDKGYIEEDETDPGTFKVTSKSGQTIRQK